MGIFADRADGFVLRNLTVRHAREHDIYILETDGYLFDSFKAYYAGGYGVLTFVEDHGVISNCEAAGKDDSGLYPGAGADTGVGRDSAPQSWKDYTDPGYSYGNFRDSQEIRNCDSHHNASGYSGTDGNATHLHHNNIYDNVLGFTTDVFTAAGHPGLPDDPDLIEYNNFYSNNFLMPTGPSRPKLSSTPARRSRSGSAFGLRGRKRQRRPLQPLLRQLAAGDDAGSPCRTSSSAAPGSESTQRTWPAATRAPCRC